MAGPENINTAVRPTNVKVKQNAAGLEAGIAPQYQLILNVTGDSGIGGSKAGFPIVAALPERYNLSMSSEWDTPFANKSIGDNFGGGTLGGLIDVGMGALGVGTRDKYQMAKVWQSSSGISLNLDFVFNAKTNTYRDVMNKHLAMLKLVAPTELWKGMLGSPGPHLLGKSGDTEGRNITLQLGKYLLLDNMIVRSVSSDIQTLCGKDGIPHAMTINAELETFWSAVTAQDLEKYFIA
jgi:hypothetical protein